MTHIVNTAYYSAFEAILTTKHEKLGDVVRVVPNELSFGSVMSYRAIYGMRLPGELKVPKDKFYDIQSFADRGL